MTLELINSPILWISLAIAAVLLIVSIAVRPWHPWRILIAAGGGALAGVGAYLLLNAINAFGIQLPLIAAAYTALGLGGFAAGIAAAWSGPWWRRTIAIVAAIAALLGGALGVNKAFGIDHNLAALLGIQAAEPAVLPTATPVPGSTAAVPRSTRPGARRPACRRKAAWARSKGTRRSPRRASRRVSPRSTSLPQRSSRIRRRSRSSCS